MRCCYSKYSGFRAAALQRLRTRPHFAQVFVSLRDQRLLVAKRRGGSISNTYTAHTHTHTHIVVQQEWEEWLACLWGQWNSALSEQTDPALYLFGWGMLALQLLSRLSMADQIIISKMRSQHFGTSLWNHSKMLSLISAELDVVAHDVFHICTVWGADRPVFTCRTHNAALADILSFTRALLLSFESTKTAWQWRQVG